MSDATDQHTRATTTGRDTRSVTLLIGAAVVIVGVVAAVLLFGIARPPELATVTESDMRPTGAVAWTAWTDGETCLSIAWPDGNTTSPRCGRDGGDVIAWTDAGIVLRSWTSTGETDLIVDPVSGNVLERVTVDPDREAERAEAQSSQEGGMEWVRAYREDNGELVVELEITGDVVWRIDAPDAYEIHNGVRSPDRNWVAMTDSARRLLVVPADGSAPPAVWVEDFDSWQHVVWQGTP